MQLHTGVTFTDFISAVTSSVDRAIPYPQLARSITQYSTSPVIASMNSLRFALLIVVLKKNGRIEQNSTTLCRLLKANITHWWV